MLGGVLALIVACGSTHPKAAGSTTPTVPSSATTAAGPSAGSSAGNGSVTETTDDASGIELCDLLSIDDVDGLTAGALQQTGHGSSKCTYAGTDDSGTTHTVFLKAVAGDSAAALPADQPSIVGVGDAARGNDGQITMLVAHRTYVVGATPTPAAGSLLRLATTIVERITTPQG